MRGRHHLLNTNHLQRSALLVALLCLNSYKPHKGGSKSRDQWYNNTKTFDHQDPTDSAVYFMEHKHKTKHVNVWATENMKYLRTAHVLFFFCKYFWWIIEFVTKQVAGCSCIHYYYYFLALVIRVGNLLFKMWPSTSQYQTEKCSKSATQ